MVLTKTFEIRNKLGIHARVAAKIVGVSNRFKAGIFLEKDGQEVNAKSLLGILTLACPQGSRLTVRIEGNDAHEVEEAMKNFEELINGKFGED